MAIKLASLSNDRSSWNKIGGRFSLSIETFSSKPLEASLARLKERLNF